MLIAVSHVFVLCLSIKEVFLTSLHSDQSTRESPGNPLFLSPYIAQGEITRAQALSKVGPLKGTDVLTYSGFITVNTTYNNNLFFWFCPAQKVTPTNAPVLLWLDGGPGVSSLFGLFVQHGPYKVDKNLQLLPRNFTWNRNYSVLYVDSPVGTGFSFTDVKAGYASNQDDVARDLYSFLLQFFKLFPGYQKNDFYAGGASYAGKYVPAISYKIHMENPAAQLKLNFKGMFIGGSFTDPVSMIPEYGPYLFYVGMLSEKELHYFQTQINKTVDLIKGRKFARAMTVFTSLMLGKGFFYNVTGFEAHENILRAVEPPEYGYYEHYVVLNDIRHAIHVGNLTFVGSSQIVFSHLRSDFLKSVKDWFTTIMNNYKVLLYNGQVDIIVCPPTTEAFLMTLPWKGLEKYKMADKIVWKVDSDDIEVAGYVRRVDSFTQVIVRDAGHITPYDQPRASYDMVQRFIDDLPF